MIILATFGSAICTKKVNVDLVEATWSLINQRLVSVFIPEDESIYMDDYEVSFGIITKMFVFFSDSIVIKAFSLNGNKNVHYLPVNVYKSFPFLTLYDGSRSSLTTIKYKNFEYLGNIQVLTLNQNHISHIDSNTFNDLYDLKVLYLHENQVTSIDGIIFKRLHNLLELSLEKNKINYVAENALDSLTELRNLTIGKNNNNVWKDEHFKNNKKLIY